MCRFHNTTPFPPIIQLERNIITPAKKREQVFNLQIAHMVLLNIQNNDKER